MQYYEALLDPARAAKRIDDLAAGDAAAADAARALLARTAPDARRLARVVDQYLATSARRWVDLGQLFSFALRLIKGAVSARPRTIHQLTSAMNTVETVTHKGKEYSLPVGLFINNKFVPSISGNRFHTVDPTHAKPIVELFEADKEDVDAAVKAAKAAYPKWSK
nr:hypothetical protein HK105_005049 [Polyrhizophydium stewartii]